jgi:FMN-binding domain
VPRAQWIWLPVAALSTSVHATTYLSVEQAQQLMFPGARLAESPLELSADQQQELARALGGTAPARPWHVWRAEAGGFFIVDEVIGKHELISYAVGLNADGSIKQVEILAYRESYGYEIRNERWRRQFVGKRAPLRMDHDIQNISGATLSCTHVTDGVNRILALYAVALSH